MLGLKHGGQGKTIRRYRTGERIPSKAMQERIGNLYDAVMEAQLYCKPIHPEEWGDIKRDWQSVTKRWRVGKVSNATLKKIMYINYHAAEKEYDADFLIPITLDRPPRKKGDFRFLSDGYCTFRTVLVYLTFALTHMKQSNWYMVAQETLEALQRHKPRVYRDMKRVIDSL